MKRLLTLMLIAYSLTLYSQTNDSLRVTWTDPNDADLDSIRLYYEHKNLPADDTIWFKSVNEAVEEWQGVSPDTGLLRIFAKAKDDSSNLSVYSTPDTVTIWQTAGGTHYDTDLLIWRDFTDLSNGAVSSWVDNVSSLDITQGTSSLQPTKSASGVLTDGSSLLKRTVSSNPSDAGSIGLVIYTSDTTATGDGFIYGIGHPSGDWDGKYISKKYGSAVGHLCFDVYDANTQYQINCYATPVFGDTVYIVATYDGAGSAKLYVDGVLLTDIANGFGAVDIFNVESMFDRNDADEPAYNGTYILYQEYYTAELTSGQVTQNYEYYQSINAVP